MALKDLVADRGKITEEMIEEIITNYIRYEPKVYELVLTPAGVALGNDAKVLVILVAILGWQYVVDTTQSVDTKPVSLEALTGIPGSTLRPILKKLKDSHLLAVTDGQYSVRIANLDAIAKTVNGEKVIGLDKRSTAGKSKVVNPSEQTGKQKATRSTEKARRKSGVPIGASLAQLLDDDFFSEERTLPQIVSELHDRAIIAKATSLSGPIAAMVRSRKLKRKKVVYEKKEIWGYRAI